MKRLYKSAVTLLTLLLLAGTSGFTNEMETAGRKMNFAVLSYNVRNCRGMDDSTDYQRVAAIIKRIKPDVVALQELDSVTRRSGGVVVLEELARRTKMYPVYGASINFQGGKYGVGILTSERPISWWSVPLPGREESRSLLIVELKRFIVCSTHFSLTEEDRLQSVEIINNLFDNTGKPVILAGDLNATPESEVIKRLEEKWTMLNDRGVPTFPADNPERCIDYIFVLKGGNAALVADKIGVRHEPQASDHLPVWVRLKSGK